MRTYDAWFPRYALGNGLMFFCRVFSPAVGRGSSALSTFLDRHTQRVNVFHWVALNQLSKIVLYHHDIVIPLVVGGFISRKSIAISSNIFLVQVY